MDKNLKNTIFCIYIKYSFKNTIINIANYSGQMIKQWSTQSLKKIDRRKNTPYNIQEICKQIQNFIHLKKLQNFKIFLNGKKNYRRKFILKNLNLKNLNIIMVIDRTPIIFNGCRSKKQKRK